MNGWSPDERHFELPGTPPVVVDTVARPSLTVKWGGQVEVTTEQLAAGRFEARAAAERLRLAVQSLPMFFAPAPLILSPAIAAQLGVRGFDGRPAPHEPNPALVSLLLTDPRQERARV